MSTPPRFSRGIATCPPAPRRITGRRLPKPLDQVPLFPSLQLATMPISQSKDTKRKFAFCSEEDLLAMIRDLVTEDGDVLLEEDSDQTVSPLVRVLDD